MSTFTRNNAEELRVTLVEAVVRCSERCLYQAAKWVAELSNSLPSSGQSTPAYDSDPDSPMGEEEEPPIPSVISSNPNRQEAKLEAREASRYLLAKSYFDCREFERCAAVFLSPKHSRDPLSATASKFPPQTPTKQSKGKAKEAGPSPPTPIAPEYTLPKVSQKALFLALYAKYMSGEKRKEEDSEMVLGPFDNATTRNKELVGLIQILESWFADRAAKGQDSSSQGWLEYLYGVILIKEKSLEEGRKWLVRSVNRCPFNWSAWLELGDLFEDYNDLQRIAPQFPQNIMSSIFYAFACASHQLYESANDTHHQLTELGGIFPDSLFLKTQRALMFYYSKDFDQAELLFSNLLRADPYRLDSLDHYSNLLYVMAARPKLAFLAQIATATDKFRPETCCIVGNYYSLKSEHEKAVMYFRRALTLDHNYMAAWIMMGHEYVELKNTHAAIESYRRAVDLNRKDYRAWYGLGQTYEILEMNSYALFYFQRAASVRPYDPKMWHAIGACYDRLDRPVQSIKAFKRALVAGTYFDAASSFASGPMVGGNPNSSENLDPEMLYQIALMYEKLGDLEEAASYMELTMSQEDPSRDLDDDDDHLGRGGGGGGGGGGGERPSGTGVTYITSKARLWLSRYEFTRGEVQRAMQLATELCEDGMEVEEAKALIRDLRARMELAKTHGG